MNAPAPRLDINASFAACHEAAHALARHIVHGKAGAMSSIPFRASRLVRNRNLSRLTSSSRIPKARPARGSRRLHIRRANEHAFGRTSRRLWPARSPRASFKEAAFRGAGRVGTDQRCRIRVRCRDALWDNSAERDHELEQLAREVSRELEVRWQTLKRLAEAFDASRYSAQEAGRLFRGRGRVSGISNLSHIASVTAGIRQRQVRSASARSR